MANEGGEWIMKGLDWAWLYDKYGTVYTCCRRDTGHHHEHPRRITVKKPLMRKVKDELMAMLVRS